MRPESFTTLMKRVRACNVCHDLPLGPRPVLQAGQGAKILIVGQAPGAKVHRSGVPWDDASGERLREWIGVSEKVFYDKNIFAILPMGFCYPGTGETGDLPPRKECAKLWHKTLMERMPDLQLILLVGGYAQTSYLRKERKSSLTETVRAWKEYLPLYLPLPHPSPLNNIWLHKNRWFQNDELPKIQRKVRAVLQPLV